MPGKRSEHSPGRLAVRAAVLSVLLAASMPSVGAYAAEDCHARTDDDRQELEGRNGLLDRLFGNRQETYHGSVETEETEAETEKYSTVDKSEQEDVVYEDAEDESTKGLPVIYENGIEEPEDTTEEETTLERDYEELNAYIPAPPEDSDSYGHLAYEPGEGEAELLARLIYHEAGNQPYEGRVAVAEVVMNRVHSSRFPDNITDVIYQPGQFSYNEEIADCPVTDENLEIAEDVIAGEGLVFNYPEVLFFRNPMITSEIPQSEETDWGVHEWYAYIGGHTFYTEY